MAQEGSTGDKAQHKPSRVTLTTLSLVLAVIAMLLTVCTVALKYSLPSRIGISEYGRYLWADRLSLPAFLIPIAAIILGIAARHKISIILAGFSFLLFFIGAPGFVGHAFNPQNACFNNLRKIDAAKNQVASEDGLTNGASISIERLSNCMERGYDVKGGLGTLSCPEDGKYTINVVGIEPRCSVHGSMSEMEAGWQKEMQKRNKDSAPTNSIHKIKSPLASSP